jgi:Ser/Thr protein kinase RdoA (MazF antagonist)
VFPVVYSTLSIEAIVAELLPNYGIDFPVACQFWHRGLSDIYLVETQTQNYILRISHHHWRTREEISFELEFLNFLAQCRLPVAYPLRTYEGELFLEIDAPEGKRYATLFNYAEGRIPMGDFSPAQSEILGKTLARIHRAALDFRPPCQRQALTLEYLLDRSLSLIAPFLQHRSSDFSLLEKIAAEIKEKLQHFSDQSPFWSVCWGDPHSGNVHFTEDNRITLFDFDQCGYGWRIFDIAKFLQVALRTGMNQKAREGFVRGYQTIQELTELEISSLQAFTVTAHIWMWGISLENSVIHNYSRLDDSFFTQRLEQLKRFISKDWQLF